MTKSIKLSLNIKIVFISHLPTTQNNKGEQKTQRKHDLEQKKNSYFVPKVLIDFNYSHYQTSYMINLTE